MKVAVLMMQKDEYRLLEPWILHHAELFGLENLYVYDNGSADERCLNVLKEYSGKGMNVVYDRSTFDDFNTRHIYFVDKYEELKNSHGYDFMMPLDCDEFVGVEFSKGKVSLSKNDVSNELSKYIETDATFKIKYTYGNHPLNPKEFVPSPKSEKVFFPKSRITALGNGFHRGEVESGQQVDTDIIYLHFHHKNYDDYIASARNKLEGLVDVNDIEALKAFKGAGHHLVKKFLMTQTEYYDMHAASKSINPSKFFVMDGVYEYLKGIGLDLEQTLTVEHDESLITWHGYVDKVREDDGSCVFTGWCSPSLNVNQEFFFLRVGHEILPGFLEGKIQRSDVVAKFPDYNLQCGFSVRFYGVTKGSLQRNEWEFHVSAGHKGTGSKLNRKKNESYFQ
ncbi:hypothetical protein IZS90_004187 [Escherichia coli]|nr:hypothetical protein [Escherichia coli]